MAPCAEPVELADALEQFVREFGLGLVGGCCGTDPEHLRRVVERLENRGPGAAYADTSRRHPPLCGGAVPAGHQLSVARRRTNANGSKAFREALLEERWDDCVDIARAQIRDGTHWVDVDYVGRDGAGDMRALASRFAASTLPLVLDSTEPAVLQAGLETLRRPGGDQLRQLRGRRRTRLPVRPDHAAGRRARRGRDGADRRGGQARTAEWKVRVAEPDHRRPGHQLGDADQRHHHRLPHLPHRHRPRRPAAADEAHRGDPRVKRRHPEVQTTSACRTSRSASTRPPGWCSTRCS